MKDPAFGICFPICLCNHILFCELLSTYTWAWLVFFCLPITYCICSQLSTLFLVQWSTQGDQSVVLARSSTSGVNTWWLLPQLLLGNLPGRAQAKKGCHLSLPDSKATEAFFIRNFPCCTPFPCGNSLYCKSFLGHLHLLEDGCAWKSVFAYFFPHHLCYFLLFSLLNFSPTLPIHVYS